MLEGQKTQDLPGVLQKGLTSLSRHPLCATLGCPGRARTNTTHLCLHRACVLAGETDKGECHKEDERRRMPWSVCGQEKLSKVGCPWHEGSETGGGLWGWRKSWTSKGKWGAEEGHNLTISCG